MNKSWRLGAAHLAGLLSMMVCTATAFAAVADLSDRPLETAGDGSTVRSNLMFILDDSGSMDEDVLPDSVSSSNVCFGSADTNRIFYDPARTYLPPVNADGTSKPDASFSSAWVDGFKPANGTTDLTANHPGTGNLAGVQLSQTATPGAKAVCGKQSDSACTVPATTTETTSDGINTTVTQVKWARVAAPGFSKCGKTANSCALQPTTTVTVTGPSGKFLWAVRKAGASASSCSTADFDVVRYADGLTDVQKTNYANWYSYYRKRILAMRSAAGRAFGKIDPTRFRVGFATIHNTSNSDGSEFLNIRDFDSGSQKSNFFSKLYTVSPSGYTPLRPALVRTGKYFAGKLSGQTDPVQYSCQRNYAILSTDGYWNTGNEVDNYVPSQLDGSTAIGNQDAAASVPRPLRDEVNGTGVSNSLADIAMYFYETDLRTSTLGNCTGVVPAQNVCENNVPGDGVKDNASHQHMTTITLGLGVAGQLNYIKNYETQTSGDYWDIRQGTASWPDPNVTSTSDTVVERIDDLWHAAVNGRGFYYSASDSVQLANSLADALGKIEAITGSASAAATSSLTPSSGDDWLFVPLYTTKTWEGTVNAYKVNTATGAILTPSTPVWSAASRIKGQASRRIVFRSVGGSNNLADFNHANLVAAGLGSAFNDVCGGDPPVLSQCATLSDAARAKVTGTNLVAYLAGSGTYEKNAALEDDQLFRTRSLPLGDIVNGAPVYVKKSPLRYGDGGHGGYLSSTASRQAVLYVAANDGMLHALKVSEDGTGGTELWAYVPSAVIPRMPVLADWLYEGKHRFFADGPPVVADVASGEDWKTVLVGGLGKGGRAYYALDITDPSAPRSLWEFTDTDLGYTYGKPLVFKTKDGTWVVAFSSGYNNVAPGDGKGYLYIVDALTGTLLKKIGTGRGDTGTPSNLGKLNAWVDDDSNNVAARLYGGDMMGNVWRFDHDGNLPGDDAFLLAQVGSSQPITTRPVLSELKVGANRYAVVSVGTGRYLGTSDVGDTSVQSVYSFKDPLTTTALGALRGHAGMVKQTLLADRSGLDNQAPVDWDTQAGWYVDFNLSLGERVNVDFDQQFNQLVVATNIPTATVCTSGGTSWLYYLDVGTGKALLSYVSDALTAGTTNIVTTTGKLVTLVQGVNGKNTPREGFPPTALPGGSLKRTSWRELIE